MQRASRVARKINTYGLGLQQEFGRRMVSHIITKDCNNKLRETWLRINRVQRHGQRKTPSALSPQVVAHRMDASSIRPCTSDPGSSSGSNFELATSGPFVRRVHIELVLISVSSVYAATLSSTFGDSSCTAFHYYLFIYLLYFKY